MCCALRPTATLSTRRYEPSPRGASAAREAIRDYYAARTPPVTFTSDDIFVTASTSEAYWLLFALLTEPGDNVLAPVVSYPLFEYLAAIHHLELRPYALDEHRGWRIDPASLHAQIDDRTRAVLIISPHNPTGMIIGGAADAVSSRPADDLRRSVRGVSVSRCPTPPLAALHPELPVFQLNGISKLFALPDLKLGWIALNTRARQFADRLELLNDTFLSSNSLTQFMLPALFDGGRDFIQTMRERVRDNLDYALERLAGCAALRVQQPDGGYYLFPKVLGWDDEEELVLHCLRHGVLVHPGYFYGYEHGTHLMMSCLTERVQLAVGLDRLLAALEK